MRFRPCIDLHQGRVKQIVGSSLDQKKGKLVENFVSKESAAHFAKLYKRDCLKGGHIIQLGEGNKQAAEEALNVYRGGLQVGGGIKDDNALEWLEKGAEKIILTSFVINHGQIYYDRLEKLVDLVSSEKITLDLSCSKINGRYHVMSNGWSVNTGVILGEETINKLANYCSEFLIHAVDKEGKKGGIDSNLVKVLSEITDKPVTYAGGISSFEDIEIIEKAGQGKIDFTVGSALDIFGGSLSYEKLAKVFL